MFRKGWWRKDSVIFHFVQHMECPCGAELNKANVGDDSKIQCPTCNEINDWREGKIMIWLDKK